MTTPANPIDKNLGPSGPVPTEAEQVQMRTALNALGIGGNLSDLVVDADSHLTIDDEQSRKPDGYVSFFYVTEAQGSSLSVSHNGQDGATGICISYNNEVPIYVGSIAGSATQVPLPSGGGQLASLDVWSAASATSGKKGELITVTADDTPITWVDASHCPEMEHLSFNHDVIKILPLDGSNKLERLHLAGVHMFRINLEAKGLLQHVLIDDSWIYDVGHLQDCVSLISFSGNNCPLNEPLDFSACSKMTDIHLVNCDQLPSVTFDVNPDLKQVFLNGCAKLHTIDLSGAAPDATEYNLSDCTLLASLTLPANFRLIDINLDRFNTLDLSNCALEKAAIETVLTSLADLNALNYANPNKIILTGNPGAAEADITIGTNKNWEVTV